MRRTQALEKRVPNSKLEYCSGDYLKGECHAEEYYSDYREEYYREEYHSKGECYKGEYYENYSVARECFRRTACLVLYPVSRQMGDSRYEYRESRHRESR